MAYPMDGEPGIPLAALKARARQRGLMIVELHQPHPLGVQQKRGGKVLKSFGSREALSRFLDDQPCVAPVRY